MICDSTPSKVYIVVYATNDGRTADSAECYSDCNGPKKEMEPAEEDSDERETPPDCPKRISAKPSPFIAKVKKPPSAKDFLRCYCAPA